MVFEWVMDSFSPMVVMGLFAVFRMPLGLLQLPTLQFDAPHNTTSNPTVGALTPEYNAVIALRKRD
ncbi:hypothetical protein NEUTE1DRAFT_143042 [Neurospora tetrasperma FGSC 2508]|uniref:Uncharacterized protein n=1 Tax=Neurospora tetrasperma (strain FGSC 2508 / ATCC MYA-4615 / P0657) TaxID=510951 RepID=F8N214_NEUT8|nr:uncharacterized protein NEUTE1DRAFT_143042 [Neurospora tetrasperma FGSC 2508]EGO53238.1 hypothetical protein NEUTE1DRAFT_143042 [Neurospora tetrasperma FGSC 2508]